MLQKEYNYSLKSHNTMGVDAKANTYIQVTTLMQLENLIRSKNYNEPLYILGGGSNVLFLQDFPGTVLNINIRGIEIVVDSDKEVLIKANAGENWHEFTQFTLSKGLGGLENLSLIPGKVGASPIQNIGAYGVEIKDVFHELEAIEIKTGDIRRFSHNECKFGYRDSVFKNELKNQYIITSVTFRLTKQDHRLKIDYGAIKEQLREQNVTNPTIQDISQAIIAIRQSKLPDPREIPNTGSFFKNPTVDKNVYQNLVSKFPNIPGYKVNEDLIKIPAGWLIEKAGWRGYRTEKVGVHDLQSLVLINHNNGTGQDIFDLSEEILQDVNEKFGIKLEREVNIIP